MGVAIGPLIKECKEDISLKELENKRLGFDAFNILFQFITTIRGIDGQPLKNKNGDVTSHLNGIFYRLLKILSFGIKPTFVFDGISPELKQKTKEERRNKRLIAKEKYDLAVKENNLEDMSKYSKQYATINSKIIEESKELLLAMGVSYIEAPSEAEAQISWMTRNKLFDYTVSQDYDSFLFNSPNLLKNLTVSGKRKVPFKNIYVDVSPKIIRQECIFKKLQINYDQLLWLSILIGTDFNRKIEGIGPITALKIVKQYNSFNEIEDYLLSKNKKIDFNYEEVSKIFLNPKIDKNPKIYSSSFNKEKIKDILINKCNFDENRIENKINEFISKKEEKEKQKTLDKWF